MPLLALENLDELCELDDPELALDPYSPASDRFFSGQRDIMRKITHTKTKMKPKQVRVVELVVAGKKPKEAAAAVGVTTQTVYKHCNSGNGIRLAQLLQHLHQYRDGPTKEHRQHILYRIAVDNEQQRPSIAISALQEINRMTGAHEQANNGGAINIVINNEHFPTSALDKLPQTYDSTLHLNTDA